MSDIPIPRFDQFYRHLELTRLLSDYAQAMVPRSGSWQTVHVPAEAFSRISRPFLGRAAAATPRKKLPPGRSATGRIRTIPR